MIAPQKISCPLEKGRFQTESIVFQALFFKGKLFSFSREMNVLKNSAQRLKACYWDHWRCFLDENSWRKYESLNKP